MHWVYYFGRVVIYLLIFPLAGWEVKGRENVPERGPVLVVCNHLHIADPPIVAASLPLKSIFMAKEELFRGNWSRFWVKNFGAFPVSRGGVDREAIRRAEDWLKKGVSLIMFPEGGRSPNAQVQPAMPGAALIALHSGVPVLPVSITGTENLKKLKIKTILWCIFHRPKITVTIGLPFQPQTVQGKLPKDRRNDLMNDMMGKIAALLPPEYRGAYDRGGGNAQN